MIAITHLWPEPPVQKDGFLTLAAVVEIPGKERQRLWYRLPEEYRPAVSRNDDPFIPGVLFSVMKTRADVHIHGEVSPSLLRNLVEYQAAWACWLPQKYHPNAFSADVEREPPRPDRGEAVMGFSGGCDSTFTAWRHRAGRAGRQGRNLVAGVFVHGFDIPLDDARAFTGATQKAGRMLSSIGMELIPVATNFREIGATWDDAYAAGVISCLMLLQGRFNAGLIASGYEYRDLHLPTSSSPLTDPMLSSDAFQVIHDGAALDKVEKVRQFGQWPEARKYLRVCWEGEHKDCNCGRCLKCVKTILIFRMNGQGLPECFERDISDGDILRLRYVDPGRIRLMHELAVQAKAASIHASWVRALEASVWINRLRWSALRIVPLRRLLRPVYRRLLPPL